jgi:hypothetical protein
MDTGNKHTTIAGATGRDDGPKKGTLLFAEHLTQEVLLDLSAR